MGPIMPRIARARAKSRAPRLILSRRPSRGEVEASDAFDEVFDQAVGHATIARMPALKPSGRLGLVLRPHSDPTAVVETLTAWAHSHGKRVIIDARDAARVPDGVEPVSAAQLVDQADALISLGGDGTLLGALRLVAQRPIPVLGVNLGSLGFLVEVEPQELDAALDRLDRGDYCIEEHSAAVLTDGRDESVAFNDIALASVPGEGAVQALLSINGRTSGRYRCDALVIATPIGSTAYSYAAGGPLVSPTLDAMIISPVAPISGISRSSVISAAEPIGLALLESSGRPALQVDGTIMRRMQPGETLEVRLRPRAGLLVRLDPTRYQRRSEVKLSLLDLPFLPEEMRDLLPAAIPSR
jgi:NAD+ kinase